MDDKLLSLEQAMNELQVDKDGLKKLLKENNLRYVIKDGQIKIPKIALMAVKVEKMTSCTQQFEKIKRTSKRRIETVPDESQLTKMMSVHEVAEKLKVSDKKIEEFMEQGKLRFVEVGNEKRIPITAAEAFKIKIDTSRITKRRIKKKISIVNKKY